MNKVKFKGMQPGEKELAAGHIIESSRNFGRLGGDMFSGYIYHPDGIIFGYVKEIISLFSTSTTAMGAFL